MKKIKYLMIIISVATLSSMIGCSDSDSIPINPLEAQRELLINGGSPWIISDVDAVIKDGFDVTNQFIGFSVTFADGAFITTNAISSAWPDQGTWEFNNGNANSILRGDGVEMEINVTENFLKLSFVVSGISGGRIAGIDGEYEFNLISQ